MLHLLLSVAVLSQLKGRTAVDGAAVSSTICTVTGPAVIDFSGRVSFVQDRCAYTLMSTTDIQLLAVFKERRRQDVSFLDHVILRLVGPTVDIRLGEGGKVQVKDKALSLSAPQTVHGVELSQNKDGVTAKASFSGYTTSIFFDGTSAQIHVTGPTAQQGLCSKSSSLAEMKFAEFSSSSCKTVSSEPADSQINCVSVTERCNLLKKAPFTSCHSLVNSDSHATACANTLCRYPDLDALSCRFLDSYGAACGMMGVVGAKDWRSKTGCSPPPQDVCQKASCSDHEFCGDDIHGRPVCLCRAAFAAGYKSKDSLGNQTVCKKDSASVSLAACLLTERGIDHTTLHLNDRTCGGQMDEKTHMVTFGFQSSKSCGAVIQASKKTMTFKNTIKNDITSAPILRKSAVKVDFSCFYQQPEVKAMPFKIKGGVKGVRGVQGVNGVNGVKGVKVHQCQALNVKVENPWPATDSAQ
ncbi:uncharacterized protein [Clinocottus analis]|uniref:uncharacterized protein n=1 Tax=Clinocottus analis TaxID=304258 RepID=UPI0035C022FE